MWRTKTVFGELKENSVVAIQEIVEDSDFENLGELTAGELSALCSNFAKACEKQHLTEEMGLFYQLADRESGYMLPQSEEVRTLLGSMLKNPPKDFPVAAVAKLLKQLKK